MGEYDSSFEYDRSYSDLPPIRETDEEGDAGEYAYRRRYEDDPLAAGAATTGHQPLPLPPPLRPQAQLNGYRSLTRFTAPDDIDPALIDSGPSRQRLAGGGGGGAGENGLHGSNGLHGANGSSHNIVLGDRNDGEYPSRRPSAPISLHDEARAREGTFDDAVSGVDSEAWDEAASRGVKRAKTESKTCDNCRKRKIKCREEDGEADPLDKSCEGCRKLGIECTFEYVRKKPGRKNGFVQRMEAERQAAISGTSVAEELAKAAPPPRPRKSHSKVQTYHSLPLPTSFDTTTTKAQVQPPRPLSSFAFSPRNRIADLDLSWLDAMIEGSAAGSFPVQDAPFTEWTFNDQAQLLALESPENASTAGSTSGAIPGTGMPGFQPGIGPNASFVQASRAVAKREPQLEDVTTWANISHFISLFLQYLYPLLPLVHRPTFAEHLATRRDLRDSDFRALLLSIVAYVISQLPTSRLVNDQFDVDALKRLQRRCHRTCKALQRTYYGPTNLTQITTIIFDTFYLLSIGLGHTAASRLGQAVQLAYSMGLHSDERTLSQGLDCIEIQLRRRVFWQLYASDKTRAIPGSPMLINDFQGVCSYPAEVDDEFITAQGGFPQPPARTSVLCGFVTVSKVFRFLHECFFHHRCVTTGMKTIPTKWTEKAEERLNRLVGPEMPEALHRPESVGLDGLGGHSEVFGMQRANILITAAIAKFALYDLRAALNEVKADQLAIEREKIAKEIHECLMTIPMEELASNGESVRGKVFHIACALCVQGPMDGPGQEVFKSWCEMFSAITFVQMPVPPPGEGADSSANTPLPS